ncbi:zinc finger MYM-type protein 4 [Salarias fasciatus]|uniref:TRASH domain-containing protein n=1 Tax=Salarias fasciatus TaxID=181472 RepID=A0A672HE97_SALFA|nr:zinc finger MYM-type protein 4 [Salarias fasciatus]
MATTETGNGHEHVSTNQVSSAGVAGAVTEGTDTESMEKQPDASPDVGEIDHRFADEKNMQTEEAQCEEKETNAIQPDESESLSQDSETVENFEGDSQSTATYETEEKIEEALEEKEKNAVLQDKDTEESLGGSTVDDEMHMSTTSDPEKDANNIDENMDTDTKEADSTHQEKTGCKVSTADDLDEMMDIGTVDEMEQEAQMKDEDTSGWADTEGSSSPAVSNPVQAAEEENDTIKEETDDKPPSFDLMQSNSSSSPETTTNTGEDRSSPPSKLNGTKAAKPSQPRPEPMRLRSSSRLAKLSSSPPVVQVKDEPVDEEYDQALISSSTASVKDEDTEEDLRIGSVFSVPPAAETQMLPIVNPPSMHMYCFNCKKSLQKGQTAFQRKGCPSLFCSTACLNASVSTGKGASRNDNSICFNCQKLIFRPQDVILAPDGKGVMKDFCSQSCLTSFNYKNKAASYRKAAAAAAATAPRAVGLRPLCSMCTRYCVSKHEVILSGSVHKLCSDSCFNRFRAVNNLSMAGCANCGSYCHSKPVMLKMEDCSKTLCNAECLAKYKEKTKVNQPCKMCNTIRLLGDMIDSKNSDDSVNLFCSSSCVMAFKVQTVSSSGSRVHCDSCGVNTVPAYHLAMSDMSIRNFCTLACVMSFQDKFKKSQNHMNVFTKLPVGSTQVQNVSSTQPKQDAKGLQKLNCLHCSRSITFKPEIIEIKDKIIFLCSVDCSLEFKKSNCVVGLCEYCKEEKIVREVKRINNKNCCFCSDGCKLLFRHNLTKSWGKHCHSCVYCHSVSKRLVTAQYGGLTEEFCSEECRSKYTMLFCHVEKCNTCGRKGKLKQSLSLLREVKHFCDLSCLLQFCYNQVATQGKILTAAPGKDTPVIANVISLAGPPSRKSDSSEGQKSTVSSKQSNNTGNISIQTETVKTHPPSPAPQKILKNKALLCKPLVQNKGVSCKTQTVDVEAQTDDLFPKILVLPVPVPVYVPVPMGMYSQCTPNPVGLPVPMPVPMFLPVTMDSAERIVETIQEIKQKIPTDPYEAELILMAEMVAEQDEKNNKQKANQREKAADKQGPEAPASDDHVSNYSDDLDTEDLENFLNNWEDASSDTGLRSPSGQNIAEKLSPMMDVSVGQPREPSPEPQPPGPPSGPPPMDIEADFTIETLEKMAQLREQSPKADSPPPAAGRRRQAQRKARDKRGKKLQRYSKSSDETNRRGSPVNPGAINPKLRSQYGIDAWKRWIQWRQTQPNLEKPRYGPHVMELKEDILHCTTAELSYGLCCFITEVKRPNGEPYSPDSLFYLCLGLQQYLFENGRVENIFMDRFYSKFSNDFTNMLRVFKPSITASGYIHSRVEEEFLWDCKQLGAYSPIVLLNTLLFFCCKYFGFTTVEEHRQLSFAHVMRCTKTNANNTKTTLLRFYPPLSITEAESDPEVIAAKRRREEENKEDILEMMENVDNPLRCPVRLYEFYLSKCSDSVKQRTNVFYLHPERCCVPNSPLWFSSVPLDDRTMEAMLVRILTVRELHVKEKRKPEAESTKCKDPPSLPEDEEDEDSE